MYDQLKLILGCPPTAWLLPPLLIVQEVLSLFSVKTETQTSDLS